MARELSGKENDPSQRPKPDVADYHILCQAVSIGHDTPAVVRRCAHNTTTCSRILAPNCITLGTSRAALKKTHLVKLTW